MNPGFQKVTEARDAYKALVKALGQDAIAELLRDFLTKYPEVQSAQWDQYTPFFNDGEACVFNVYSPRVRLVGDNEEEEPRDVYDIDEGKIDLKKDLDALEKQLSDADDILQECFGDHATVTVTRTGIDVSECSHD